MEYKGRNLCDYCFEPVEPGKVCAKCALTASNYHPDVGLLKPGTNLLGKYIIGRVLGRGGFGATYLAFSSEKDRAVAIKEYFPAGMAYRGTDTDKIALVSADKNNVFQKGAKRFFEEAKTMSRFNNNKNVVSVYEFFYANDTAYYSMEYLDGIDLKGYVEKKGGRISEGEAISIMLGVAEGFVAIHSTGTLHRDISPDNIFICTDGLVKLIDFGAAKQVVGEQSQSLSVILKQGFAPVEQYQKDGKQGMWTDIYALGASIYYALTGKVPEDAMSRLEKPTIVFDPALGISDMMTAIINKCMDIKMANRYQSALELLDALESVKSMALPIGGQNYVQSVYNTNNIGTSGLNQGESVQFSSAVQNVNPQPYPSSAYNPYAQNQTPYVNSQMPQANGSLSQYMNSQYVNTQYQQPVNPSQYMNSQYMSQYIDSVESKKNNTVKGIVIGISAVVVAAIIITVCVIVVKRTSQPQPTPDVPFGGQMVPGQMPPGQMPQGQVPGQMPQAGAAQDGTAQGQTP